MLTSPGWRWGLQNHPSLRTAALPHGSCVFNFLGGWKGKHGGEGASSLRQRMHVSAQHPQPAPLSLTQLLVTVSPFTGVLLGPRHPPPLMPPSLPSPFPGVLLGPRHSLPWTSPGLPFPLHWHLTGVQTLSPLDAPRSPFSLPWGLTGVQTPSPLDAHRLLPRSLSLAPRLPLAGSVWADLERSTSSPPSAFTPGAVNPSVCLAPSPSRLHAAWSAGLDSTGAGPRLCALSCSRGEAP